MSGLLVSGAAVGLLFPGTFDGLLMPDPVGALLFPGPPGPPDETVPELLVLEGSEPVFGSIRVSEQS